MKKILRQLSLAVSLSISLNSAFSLKLYAQEIQYRIVVDDKQAGKLKKVLGEGVEVKEPKGPQDLVTAVVILVGAAAVAIVADAVSDLVWELTSTGVIVDTRKIPVEISTHPSLSPRQLVLVSEKGTEIFVVSKREEIAPMVEALIKGIAK